MVGRTGEDRLGAVELLESDQQGEFVLEGLRAEGPKQIGFRACRGVPSIRRPDQQRTTRNTAILEGLDFRREGPTRKLPASLIQQNPELPLASSSIFSARRAPVLTKWISNFEQPARRRPYSSMPNLAKSSAGFPAAMTFQINAGPG